MGRNYKAISWDINQLKQLYLDEGLSISETANRLGYAYGAVHSALRRFGIPRRHKGSEPGEKHPSWKGGKVSTGYGYFQIKKRGHCRANKQGYVLEHILVWEQTHNRPLPKGWSVHHINGIKSDNRPANLKALPSKKHNTLIPVLKRRIRELEIENFQLRKAFENKQAIFYINEN